MGHASWTCRDKRGTAPIVHRCSCIAVDQIFLVYSRRTLDFSLLRRIRNLAVQLTMLLPCLAVPKGFDVLLTQE